MELCDGTLASLLDEGDGMFIEFVDKISKHLDAEPENILFTTSDDDLDFCSRIGDLKYHGNTNIKFVVDGFTHCDKLLIEGIDLIMSIESGLISVFFKASDEESVSRL